MDREEILNPIKSAARKVSGDLLLELVHVELAGSKRNLIVRVFLDKEGGVTLEDCSTASRAIEEILDADDLIPTSYVLEVSSPGLERELYSLHDFKKFAGKLIRVKMAESFAGKKLFKGILAGVSVDTVTIEDGQAGRIELPFDKVTKANLVFDLSEELKKK